MYWLVPLIPVVKFWDFFVHTDGGTTLSSAVMFVLIIGLPVVKYILRTERLPFDVNYVWVFIFLLCLLLMPIIEKMLYVAGAGVVGSILGSFAIKQADKMKKQADKEKDEDELVNKIVEKLRS